MKKLFIVLILILLVGNDCQSAFTTLPSNAIPEPSETGTAEEVIAFYSDRDGNTEIYL